MRVLRRQTSHLLLIRTNLGYETALTAAWARQGCSTSALEWFGLVWSLAKLNSKRKRLM
jgi:hypothetical protein